MTPFDLPTNLAIVLGFTALLLGGLVVLAAPLEIAARLVPRFGEWLDGVVQRVL